MHEYTFDVTVSKTVRVEARTLRSALRRAKQVVTDKLDGGDIESIDLLDVDGEWVQ